MYTYKMYVGMYIYIIYKEIRNVTCVHTDTFVTVAPTYHL